jgi:hypothetical protein
MGDYAFVVSGSQVPFILRRAYRSEVCYGDLIETLNSGSEVGYGDLIETLNSATTTQSIYVPAGKDAKAPKSQENCYQTHSDSYYVVGDAYVHGVMNGEFSDPGTRQSIFLV